ncbi:hypothetical protein [Amycolatopsis jiangsuensis]|uniref:Uncharacterized protein n=1 Tax=Amycolatopsis jiangsuensis TaxID=1181879 RepID=A0A840IXD3_9PSEU|nr:hypothetical protein [Amycolatopsis jiangsuensis]MBB4686075.1 hypothetical protein [Amycolatopsis jiangsuensis]
MRTPFGAVALGAALLLAGCSTAPAAAPPSSEAPGPLTAVSALGDLGTLDYCSLLDPALLEGSTVATPDSSFTDCQADLVQKGRRGSVTIGPPAADRDPNLRQYAYPGRLPDGITVRQTGFAPEQACARAIIFADGTRLPVSVSGGDPAARCGGADAVVGGVLAALTGNGVRHVQFPDRSWGRVDSCALLQGHDLAPAAGAGTETSEGMTGHSCIRGTVSVDFAVVKQAPAGPPETLGGRTARVATDGAFCRARTVQPSPAVAGRAEQVTVSVVDTTGSGGDAACAGTRTAAALVFAKIP